MSNDPSIGIYDTEIPIDRSIDSDNDTINETVYDNNKRL